jgi:ketosteroid isomerase-like protein
MSLEQNKATVLQFYNVYDRGNLAQAKEMVAPNVVVRTVTGTVIRGSDRFFEHRQIRRAYINRYPLFFVVVVSL